MNEQKTLQEALTEGQKPTRIPKTVYDLQVIDSIFGQSKNTNNPMFTLTCELIDNPEIVIDGQPIDINGTQGLVWLTLTEKAFVHVARFHKGCGLPLDIDLHTLLQKPDPEIYKGAKFKALCYSKPSPQIDDYGNPIMNPYTGKQIIYQQFQIGEILYPQS